MLPAHAQNSLQNNQSYFNILNPNKLYSWLATDPV